MNKLALIAILCPVICCLSCQSLKTADGYYDKAAYYPASEAYQKIVKKEKDPAVRAEIYAKLGMSYFRMNRIEPALGFLQKGIEGGYSSGECMLAYASALQMSGAYEKAIACYEKSRKLLPDNPLIAAKIRSCRFALKNNSTSVEPVVSPLSAVNTSGSEYGAAFYKNNSLLYSSTGTPDSTAKRDISVRSGMGFSRLYVSEFKNGRYQEGKELKYATPTFGNDGGLTYSPVYDRLYCTRFEINGSNYYIYTATIDKGKIFETAGLKLPKSITDMGHPSMSEDGKRLYFTSTMKGGYGQADIWYVESVEKNKWSEPINAGSEVNTPGNEVFPHIRQNKLYFSSDFHPGLGGLDIFVCGVNGDKHTGTAHFPAPVNSSYDDFNLVVQDGKSGVFVSNRNNTAGSDDIYTYSGKLLPTLLPAVEDESETDTTTHIPAPPMLAGIPPRQAAPEAGKETVTPEETTAEAGTPVVFTLRNIYYEFDKSVLISFSRKQLNLLAELLQKHPDLNIDVASHTDVRGEAAYNKMLSEKRAATVARYLADNGIDPSRITYQGYGSAQPLIAKAKTEREHLLNRRTTFTLTSTVERLKIGQESIPSRLTAEEQSHILLENGYYARINCGFNKTTRQQAHRLLSTNGENEAVDNLERDGWKVYCGPFADEQATRTFINNLNHQTGLKISPVKTETKQ